MARTQGEVMRWGEEWRAGWLHGPGTNLSGRAVASCCRRCVAGEPSV
jgi:hypothetical protein